MSILENLYFGDYSANEKDLTENQTKVKIHEGINATIKHFRNNLNGDDLNLFNNLLYSINELGTLTDFDSYKQGVKFGIDLMNDVY